MSFLSVPTPLARWLLAVALLSACSTSPNVMQPTGEGASQIANLGWLMFGIAAVVDVVVMAMLAGSLWRRRDPAASSTPSVQPPPAGGRRFILVSGVVIPRLFWSVCSPPIYIRCTGFPPPTERPICEST